MGWAIDLVEKGKLIIAAAKSLKRYQLGDAKIAAFLYATSFAGRAGLFASALRYNKNVSKQRLTFLAAEEGFSSPDLESRLLPWLEDKGLCRVRRANGDVASVDNLVLRYQSILTAVADLYDSVSPTKEDIGCLQVLEVASTLPTPESEVLHQVALVIGEKRARTAVSLAKGYSIVSYRSGKGLPEPVLFSAKLWTRCIDRAARALTPLNTTERAVILEFVDRVRSYQGLPESVLRRDAERNGVQHLVDLAIGVGLINRTDIQMADGSSRAFLTSPHFYGDLADEYGEDMCDRVKIFLDSIRNGQHFGDPRTGRIFDPELLLHRLLNTGVIGPCTAIGTDYVTSEKAGIVRVRRASPTSGQCHMELVQRDTVSKVLEVVRTGRIEGEHSEMTPAEVREGTRFRSIEQHRAEAGQVPHQVAEAERAIIMKLREG